MTVTLRCERSELDAAWMTGSQANMSSTISPLAPKTVPDMPPIAGVRFATAAAGIR